MQALADEHWQGANDHNYRLWMLINLEVFWRVYFDRMSVGDVEAWIAEGRRGAAAR